MGRHSGRDNEHGSGYHRAVNASRRRKVAAWPLACLTALTLIALGSVGWAWLHGTLESQAEAQTSPCAEGTTTITVLAAPTLEKSVTTAATRWNESGKVVRAHCIQVTVKPMATDQVIHTLNAGTASNPAHQQIAGWITESSQPVHDFAAAKPELISSPAEQVAHTANTTYLYLGLADSTLDNVHKHATQVFRDFLKQPAQQAEFAV